MRSRRLGRLVLAACLGAILGFGVGCPRQVATSRPASQPVETPRPEASRPAEEPSPASQPTSRPSERDKPAASRPKPSEPAFKVAAQLAFRDAVRKAEPFLLEPIMVLEVVVPGEFVGDVLGDLNARRGRVRAIGERAGAKVIEAHVPLAEVFGYATVLRSLTQGRGVYTMQVARYEEVPKGVVETILSA